MASDCPICMDGDGTVCVWECNHHKVCEKCLFKLFEPQGVTTCPMCRAKTHRPLCVGIHGAETYLWASDNNFAIIGNRSTNKAHMVHYTDFDELLTTFVATEVVMGARVTPDGVLLYLAAGHCTQPFFDLFKPEPPYIPALVTCDRLRRRLHRDLSKDLLAFTTCDGIEDVRQFLDTYIFPIEMEEVEIQPDETP